MSESHQDGEFTVFLGGVARGAIYPPPPESGFAPPEMGYDQLKTIIFPSHTPVNFGSSDFPPEIFLEKSLLRNIHLFKTIPQYNIIN